MEAFNRYGKIFLSVILTLAVLLGAYLGFVRFLAENGSKRVELVVDLNDLKKMAAYEKKPLGPILESIKGLGVSGIGVFEETLPDANALGEIYYAQGSGILRIGGVEKEFAGLVKAKLIRADRTYIYAPEENSRKRIYDELSAALGDRSIHFLGSTIMEVDESEDELRTLGLGISDIQAKFLRAKGFDIVPRVWNDQRYHLGNIGLKIARLKGNKLVIFDKEEILGYPNAIKPLAEAMVRNSLKFGHIEIIKQDGSELLRKLIASETIRVHSIPGDELKKLDRNEALDRLVRAVRERSVRLVYLRPFLPPQIDANVVDYNLDYFKSLKVKLAAAGFTVGSVEKEPAMVLQSWQIWLLGVGVLIGALFLFEAFVAIPIGLIYLLLAVGGVLLAAFVWLGFGLPMQKILAFTAAVVFPSFAVISTFSRTNKTGGRSWVEPIYLILNVLSETSIGIFLMVGLLADYRFMSGIEVFPAVKAALVLPVLIVGAYFLYKQGEGSLMDKIKQLANKQISLLSIAVGLVVIAALGVLIARSGNFIIPVPSAEKYLRDWLEMLLFARPRTKEFLIGYPALFLAAAYYLKGEKNWLWLFGAIGVLAPLSVFNSFSHIHTPIIISVVRTFNGLALGVVVGMLAWWLCNKFLKQ